MLIMAQQDGVNVTDLLDGPRRAFGLLEEHRSGWILRRIAESRIRQKTEAGDFEDRGGPSDVRNGNGGRSGRGWQCHVRLPFHLTEESVRLERLGDVVVHA